MSPPTPTVKTSNVTVHVDTDNGTVNVIQSPKPGNAGEFVCELDVNGTSSVSVKGYLTFLDQSDLKPDEGTTADSFQEVIFPFQDAGGNTLTPTFQTQTTHGSVSALVSVLIGGSYVNVPKDAVVIIDW
ncbi:hypothetical protein K8I85_19635 [bacterium]|nr:hypothetical protein [bacterium]